jgi:signal transduction histidine kinase
VDPSEARPRRGARRPGWVFLVGYLVSAGLGTALLAVALGDLHPLLLAGAVAVYLAALGFLWRRFHNVRDDAQQAHWRDLMPCYLSVQDRELRIIESNALFRQDFGERIGERCYRAYKNRDDPCPNCPVLKTFEDGQNHAGEETVVTRQGEHAHVLVLSTPLLDRRGRTAAVMEMSTNITESKHLQHELDRSKRYFKQLFDVVPCYITVQDRDLRVLEANELFREDFGECSGEHCYRAYKHRESVCPDCPVEKSFADGAVHSSEEIVTTRDGRRANVIVHSMPVRDERGQITAVMEVSTNITEVKRLQQELTMMGMAVAGTAHRIKNILMGLEGGIFVVNTGFETGEQSSVDEGWEMVERNVAKISRLVKDLLFCSKERQPRYKNDVAPGEIVREVCELYRPRIERDGIALELEIAEPPQRDAYDPEGIHNLVANLVANAIDACRFDPAGEGKQHVIRVGCRQDGVGAALIEVADNGPGIPEDALHQVFRGFFSTKGTEGTGLGLLVVQKVAEEHGGSVSFRSRPGEGTTFSAVLHPRAEAGAEVTQPVSASRDERRA